MFNFLSSIGKDTDKEETSAEKFVSLMRGIVDRHGRDESRAFTIEVVVDQNFFEVMFSSGGIHSVSSRQMPFRLREAYYLSDPGGFDLDQFNEFESSAENLSRHHEVKDRVERYSIAVFSNFMNDFERAEINTEVEIKKGDSEVLLDPYEIIQKADEEIVSIQNFQIECEKYSTGGSSLIVSDDFNPVNYEERCVKEEIDFLDLSAPSILESDFHSVGVLWSELRPTIESLMDSHKIEKVNSDGDEDGEIFSKFAIGDDGSGTLQEFNIESIGIEDELFKTDRSNFYTSEIKDNLMIDENSDKALLELHKENRKLEETLKKKESILKLNYDKYVETMSLIIRRNRERAMHFEEDYDGSSNVSPELFMRKTEEADEAMRAMNLVENERLSINRRRKVLLSKMSLSIEDEGTLEIIERKIDAIGKVENFTLDSASEIELNEEREALKVLIDGDSQSNEFTSISSDDLTLDRSRNAELLEKHLEKLRGGTH